MGQRNEKEMVVAWCVTLVFDNLVLQVVKSLTIKLWILSFVQFLKGRVVTDHEELDLWFEEYMKTKLPTMYTSNWQGDDNERGIEYDVAGMSF
ncbi:hypothetical protein CYMTET_32700 [Cymbomonas tetramitiformis]|uniref:Uncharacterized protein n=1 Tax=Cymbomonas tetramitiformis TaxID=36881 RepID=A0AAE0FE96_9CHLO|nr:hypothetical protein CYMTET_32700 [Cymbomonas tetramitiformis]